MTHFNSENFKKNADRALHNVTLQKALRKLKSGFVNQRAERIKELPEFDQIRDFTTKRKNHTLEHLDFYLEHFEKEVLKSGGQVHWTSSSTDACQKVIDISRQVNATRITKSKSMVTEEIALNKTLIAAGFKVTETDLGEYIIQLLDEPPAHIVVPAIHVLKEEIATKFYEYHQNLDPARQLNDPQALLNEARITLRNEFLTADVGITGANCLIAENGRVMIVTNEGNADLTQTCAKVHIVIASLEKIVPTVEDALNILRLLTRSATGQETTSYVTFAKGPRRENDLDGPQAFHVILVDHGRSRLVGSEFQDILRCIRCGACLNHCPIYNAIGGQAYGSVYPGPMGAVLSPSLFGLEKTKDLPNASTFCGRCEAVCPMNIPLPKMMRYYREQEYQKHLAPITWRSGLKGWAFLAKHPSLYHFVMGFIVKILGYFGKQKGRFHYLPLASGWTHFRDMPAPFGKTFHQLWRHQLKKKKHEG